MLAAGSSAAELVAIPAGGFRSVLPLGAPGSETTVAPFWLEREPVTNAEFAAFVRERPSWRRDRVPQTFAGVGYLGHWQTDLEPTPEADGQPVTRVSWFAARAFCEARGRRLPSWHEWEIAAYGDGVPSLRGELSEWVEDFGSLMVSADNREQSDPEKDKFCGSGALGLDRKDDYGVLMRVALLSSLRAADLTANLGFRCASSSERGDEPSLPAASDGAPTDSVYQLSVPLEDQSGKTTTLAAFAGHPTMVSLFYASCPNVCPLLVASVRRLERELDDATRAELRVLLVSLDPARDTPAVLADLAKRHALDLSRWKIARPRERDVRAIAGVLGIPYRRLPNGELNHASVITLLDGAGRALARSAKLGALDPGFLDRVRAAASPRAR